jgi:hypothetical protein
MRIQFTAFKCGTFVQCISWQTILTTKAKSGMVIVMYWRQPTMEIYSDESSKSGVSYVFEEETIGVGIEFTVSI